MLWRHFAGANAFASTLGQKRQFVGGGDVQHVNLGVLFFRNSEEPLGRLSRALRISQVRVLPRVRLCGQQRPSFFKACVILGMNWAALSRVAQDRP